ncbi:polysaccharide export protein [Paucihalobacter ruber]|uniref:Polysaccharide export protein n=1 Tax=Paucihalobacter ruber TaxID=2567861 RepID=A0A506PQ39_9FLAO|nr:polysaccharide biosynthesis/export family protein [Paucihalobacter ruber]TPV35986.1 polysaccharide export protein [Paucihalobacter ruber]
MVKNIYFKFSLITILAVLFTGCASSKKINYFHDKNDIEVNSTIINYQPTIQYGDMLSINVSSFEPELAIPFNIVETRDNQLIRQVPYIVNTDGEINFPVLGKIKVAQLTTQEVTNKIKELLAKYLNNPTVIVQFINFKISVLGEVRTPGSYTILNERINIPEALALAGDLTIYGNRKTVTLIREHNGERKFIPIDLTNKELFNSPYYFLAQNDIIYVEANKTRVNSSAVGPNTAILVSSISILISLIAILVR